LDNFEKNLDEVISPFFTQEELEILARESGFVKRTGKITGSIFLELIIFNSEQLKTQSLNDLTVTLNKKYQIDMAKQSLNERFNENAVTLVQMALEKMLNSQIDRNKLFEIEGINRILVKDSVCFQLDESFADKYPGSGGSASKAAVRIQFEYDLLNGKIIDLSLNPYTKQDATDSLETIDLTQEGDLILRDLAYMSIKVLQEIKGIFLCRLKSQLSAYELNEETGEYVLIDFKLIYHELKTKQLNKIEKVVYLGKEKLKVRLFIYLLPEEEYARRIRKATKKNASKTKSKTLSKEYKSRAGLNLFITNSADSIITLDNAWKIYKLRWQIELIFKIWKSICKIDKVKKVKEERLECYIFSKLILIVSGWRITWQVANWLYKKEQKALSFFKAFKTLIREQMEDLKGIFVLSNKTNNDFLKEFYETSKRNHLKEQRKGRVSVLETLACLALTDC
jgi:hypothetical protein